MKSFLSGKTCLILVIIQKIQKFFDETNKNLISKMKDEFGGIIVTKFVGSESKMHSIKNVIQEKE